MNGFQKDLPQINNHMNDPCFYFYIFNIAILSLRILVSNKTKGKCGTLTQIGISKISIQILKSKVEGTRNIPLEIIIKCKYLKMKYLYFVFAKRKRKKALYRMKLVTSFFRRQREDSSE